MIALFFFFRRRIYKSYGEFVLSSPQQSMMRRKLLPTRGGKSVYIERIYLWCMAISRFQPVKWIRGLREVALAQACDTWQNVHKNVRLITDRSFLINSISTCILEVHAHAQRHHWRRTISNIFIERKKGLNRFLTVIITERQIKFHQWKLASYYWKIKRIWISIY